MSGVEALIQRFYSIYSRFLYSHFYSHFYRTFYIQSDAEKLRGSYVRRTHHQTTIKPPPNHHQPTTNHWPAQQQQLGQRVQPYQVHPLHKPGGKLVPQMDRELVLANRKANLPKCTRISSRPRGTGARSQLPLSVRGTGSNAGPHKPMRHQAAAFPACTSPRTRQTWRRAAR